MFGKIRKFLGSIFHLLTHQADRIINLVDGRLESDETLDTFVSTHDPKNLDRRMFIM